MGGTYAAIQLATLIGVVITFALLLLYVLWPGNRKQFDDAARVPFNEDSEP